MKLHLHPFRPRLLDAVKGYNRGRLVQDVGAGLTVGVVALPLAMAGRPAPSSSSSTASSSATA
jgi:SulP family sulfate permease